MLVVLILMGIGIYLCLRRRRREARPRRSSTEIQAHGAHPERHELSGKREAQELKVPRRLLFGAAVVRGPDSTPLVDDRPLVYTSELPG